MKIGLLIDHGKAVRIPLLIIAAGIAMTFWVDQIQELFLLLVSDASMVERLDVIVMAALLGFAVWHTSRTVYRFDIPTLPTLSDPRAAALREWMPRILGTMVPLLMGVGTWSVQHSTGLRNSGEQMSFALTAAFLVEAAVLFAFFVVRRRVFHKISSMALRPADDPRVSDWRQLPLSVRLVYLGLVSLNVVAVFVVVYAHGFLAHAFTSLGVVLMCASFLTVSGTYLTIQAARWQFPLLTFLLLESMLLQLLNVSDNHHVRFYEGMHSSDSPDPDRVVASAPLATSFEQYEENWSQVQQNGPVYVVSAEGGGIRAAAWTALVLSELEARSNGEFSKHMLAGSGISGGSLGLALFAAMVSGERRGILLPGDLPDMARYFNERDFLGGTIETMFLTDFTQRFVPGKWFIDRGERLEQGWESAWHEACVRQTTQRTLAVTTRDALAQTCSAFATRWSALWQPDMPALFFNSTQVDSGERFIQHPFSSIRQGGDLLGFFNAATSSAGILPGSSPLSAVVHNSARFTYISPAGTLPDASHLRDKNLIVRQVVDGGYFENSGTTTLAELLEFVIQRKGVLRDRCQGSLGQHDKCPIRLIHISNDPSVESMRSDDDCGQKPPPPRYGEIRAPLMALVDTRDARAATARAAIRSLFARDRVQISTTDPFTDDTVYHFRLCQGQHHLPLGWTLSPKAYSEMRRQLGVKHDQEGPSPAERRTGPDPAQLTAILAELGAH
jgi:hypothetical protein